MWWDQTIARWHREGLPSAYHFSQVFEIARAFGLDPYRQFWSGTTDSTIAATRHHVEDSLPAWTTKHHPACPWMSSDAIRDCWGNKRDSEKILSVRHIS